MFNKINYNNNILNIIIMNEITKKIKKLNDIDNKIDDISKSINNKIKRNKKDLDDLKKIMTSSIDKFYLIMKNLE